MSTSVPNLARPHRVICSRLCLFAFPKASSWVSTMSNLSCVLPVRKRSFPRRQENFMPFLDMRHQNASCDQSSFHCGGQQTVLLLPCSQRHHANLAGSRETAKLEHVHVKELSFAQPPGGSLSPGRGGPYKQTGGPAGAFSSFQKKKFRKSKAHVDTSECCDDLLTMYLPHLRDCRL